MRHGRVEAGAGIPAGERSQLANADDDHNDDKDDAPKTPDLTPCASRAARRPYRLRFVHYGPGHPILGPRLRSRVPVHDNGSMRRRGPLIVLAIFTTALIYVRWFRPWQLTWGATADEVSRSLPGDEMVSEPNFNATRAITIAAPPKVVWPWIVQVGLTRAGWYSYDLLDNLGRPSARRVIPEFQHLAPGDVVPMSPNGKHGMRVQHVDAPHSMIWGTPGDTTWAWQLEERPDGSTRLIARVRSRYRWFSPSVAFSLLLEFADVWMMRKMLLNLRARSEGVQLKTNKPQAQQ